MRSVAKLRHLRPGVRYAPSATARLALRQNEPDPIFEADGPDTVRNGIALTGTAHWLFDRGLMTFTDDFQILLSPYGIPDDLDKLIRPGRMLAVPDAPELRPHATYLQWHRDNCFKA
ncbi:HNH endonuclease [Lysobacter korlensis]|uniref:HNH endonuclease n=1 Tax=Lysobacter korlensis TaxID=553636 RepID=A0ABV6RQT0_9GAMM